MQDMQLNSIAFFAFMASFQFEIISLEMEFSIFERSAREKSVGIGCYGKWL